MLYVPMHDYWKYLFSKLNHTIDQFPPTKDTLEQHILRAILQSYIWSKSTHWKNNPSPWLTGMLTSVGMSIHCGQHYRKLQKHAELKNCKCKNLYSHDTCTYKTYAIPCSELCRCDGVCENWYHFFNDEVRGEKTQRNLFFVWLYIYK